MTDTLGPVAANPGYNTIDPTAYQRMLNARTIDRLQSDRRSYLCAVAQHHARVAAMAIQMQKQCRPDNWNTEWLEAVAAEIEKSHIEAFGTPMVEPVPAIEQTNKPQCRHGNDEETCDRCLFAWQAKWGGA